MKRPIIACRDITGNFHFQNGHNRERHCALGDSRETRKIDGITMQSTITTSYAVKTGPLCYLWKVGKIFSVREIASSRQ